MTEYLHHVPGRLRLRSRILRSDSPARRRLLRELGASEGIRNVRLNAKAASVTVIYDKELISVDAILEQLRAYDGWARLDRRPPATPAHGDAVARQLPAMVGKAALNLLVNKGVSASLATLLGTRG